MTLECDIHIKNNTIWQRSFTSIKKKDFGDYIMFHPLLRLHYVSNKQINKLYQDLACTDMTACKNKHLERERERE